MTTRHRLLAVLTAAIWGFNFVVIEWGMAGVPPLLFVAVRFFVVAAPAVLLLAPRPPVALWKIAVVGTFLSLGQFAFLYVSIDAGMPAGLASLVLQSQVVLTILAAAVVLRERPSRPQLIGVVLGTAGLMIVAAGRDGHIPLPGPAAVPVRGLLVGGRQRGRARPEGARRAVPDHLVGARRTDPDAAAGPAGRRAGRCVRRAGGVRLEGGRLHRLHRGAGQLRGVRRLELAARALPVERGRAVGAAGAAGRDPQRLALPRRDAGGGRSWPVGWCWSSACSWPRAGCGAGRAPDRWPTPRARRSPSSDLMWLSGTAPKNHWGSLDGD